MAQTGGSSAASQSSLLALYLSAQEDEAGAWLDRLLREEVEPVVDRVLASWFGRDATKASELSELRNETLFQLLRRLRTLREDPEGSPITDLRSYAATVARNVCRERLRRHNPERDRVRRKLWHLLKSDAEFQLWKDAAGRWLCRVTQRLAPTGPPSKSTDIRRFAADFLDCAPGPVPVADLVAATAHNFGMVTLAGDLAEDSLERLPDPRHDASTELLWRDFLSGLWSEIRLLPANQAAALLLGLRDSEGRNALILLPATGTASLRQIAAVLGLSPESLADLWNQLPLPDRQIAEMLGLTRQQVINLRKSARERLARRMEKRGFAP